VHRGDVAHRAELQSRHLFLPSFLILGRWPEAGFGSDLT
jgi:hypothetical protein